MDQQTQQRRTPLPSSNPGSVHEPSPTHFTDEHAKVEDLPLDKKLEVLRKYNPYDYYEENRYIDAQDTVNSWCLGQIVQVDNKSLNIHFDGWSSRWDIWQKVTSFKIAPFRKNSRGYTGQNKVALRQNLQFSLEELQLHKQRVQRFIDGDMNGLGAFETTQYLRGGLYIYVDFLLQHTPYNEEQIDAINDFLYNVLRLIVTWLKKIPKLVPLYAQLKVNSDLFLIDENIAILQSAYELMDILKKLFCCCHRSIKYYIHNDKNPVNFDHPVTVKMDHINFEQNRKIDDDNIEIDEIREAVVNRKSLVFGQFMNFINIFAEIGGFDAIIDFLKYESDNADDKIPLEMYSLMTLPFKNCIDVFSPTFAQHFVNSVKDIVVNRLKTITEKELKEIDKESVGRMLNDLKEFLTLALTEEQSAEIIESNILIMALRFLKSTYLEKRLKGISDIKSMIDRIEIQIKKAKLLQQQDQDDFKQDARGSQKKYLNQQNYQDLMDPNMRAHKPPKYLTPEILKNWILNEKILEIVLGENTHLEIVKRSGCILKFLAKQDALPLESIDLIWKSQLGKHEEMVRVIYQMIQELVPNLESKYIDIFYQKIQQVPPSQYDDKFLEFLKNFTQKSLESHYDLKSNEGSMAETSPIPYEEYIIQKERNILSKIGEAIQNQNNLYGEEKQYGLPIFWDLIQDRTPIQVSNEIMQIGITSICEILKQNYSHPIRMQYLIKALDNLLRGESIVQSTIIAQSIINEYSLFDEPKQSISSQQLISQSAIIMSLNKQVQLIDCIIKNILNYHEQVKEKVKTLAALKKTLPEDVSNYIFVGKHSHESIINQQLNFLEFLIVQSNLQVNIGTHNIDNLWQIFVQQPNFSSDQNLFLKWINLHRESQYEKREYFLFNDEERKYFFTKILCNPTYVQKIPYGQVKCFHKYFKVINRQEENIELIRRRLCVINYDKLIGLDTLWRIAIESENDKSRDESMDLLVDLHLKFDQSITQPDQQRIWGSFVDQCMKNLDSPEDGLVANTLQLISRFLDRYEGKKALKPEFKSSQFTNLQPLQVTVLLRNDQTRKVVHVSYFQTIGFLRQKIAEAFEFQINEFLMYIKNSYVDPDEDDEKYMKEIGLVQSVIIQKNNMYNPDNHPKFLISNNHSNYDKLFYLLSKENPSLIETTWDLLSKLPVNAKLEQEIKDLSGVMDNAKNWEKILDPKSTNKLLYSLKIINNLHAVKKDQKSQRWRYKFVQMGGFSHLLKTFISLEIKQIDTNLTIKCIEQLIMILDDFITNDKELVKEVLDNKDLVVMRSINFVDLISDYTIAIEKKRGYSFEDLTKRIQQNKQKKNKYKSYMAVNKGNQGAQQQQQQEEEDDQESQEYNQAQLLMKQFHEDSQIIFHLFKFIFFTVFTHEPSSATAVTKYQNLEGLIIKSTVICENWFIRTEVLKQLKELLSIRTKNPQDMRYMQEILNVMLFKVTHVTEKYEQRCAQFFESLGQMIDNQHTQEFEILQNQCEKLIEELAYQIFNREIREKNTQDSDQLLVGKMRLLKSLLFKFPQFKQATGNILTDHLLHACLFEVPQGGTTKNQNKSGPPKCKSYISRKGAVQLLAVLCRDCVPNLMKVLNYMQQFNQNPSWRTNKDHDWNISLMDSEKSSTGYVGIKNLGCICYMNSLFQQLFMIQSFRNDLLSVKDPNTEKVEKEENMLYQLQVLFAGLLKSEKQYVSPKGFCHAFKDWEGQPTNVLEQMDVEEFFNMIMDRIETAIKTTPQQDTIKYHFGGKFASEMICKGCPHKYEREEPFLSISIPVKNKKSILEGLNAFIQGDMLEGDNAYLCEKCDKKVDALKRTCVKRLPRYLIVALRRFEFDYDKMIRVKVNDYCEFPMEFSMEPYTQEGLARREKLQKMKEERGEEEDNGAGEIEMDPLKYPNDYYEYSLSGIVVHSGTADSGHYYSFVKDREHPESGKWYELNDHIVRDFDPNDIPQECYGGEDTFQSYNMVQMKSMKWRNAYLLFYERKTPVDVISDDENERSNVAQSNQCKEDVEMKNAHNSQEVSILQEIEEQIAYENQKYWQNRFLFGNEYHEFVYDLSLNWNTSCIIPMNYLTKNNDSHLVGYPIPKEYEKDIIIREPQDIKMPINVQLIPELEERVFKFAAGFYITILQRSQMKMFIPQMLNLLKSYINKNYNCASWLLSEFCNLKIIEENLLQCGSKEMRKFIVGLLYCAMLKVYPEEQAHLNLYWTDPNNNKTVLGNLALVLIYNVFNVKKFVANSSQYFQLIARLSSLGSAMREFFLRGKLIGRLMEYFFDDVSPHRDFFRDFTDINPQFKELPDIGLPTKINRKQMSQFQELLERRRMKNLQDAPAKYKYLIEAVSNCIRGFKNGPKKSPFQLDDIQFESLLSQERDLFIPESKFLKKVFAEAKKNRSIAHACKCYIHFTWTEQEGFKELLGVIQNGLNENDYDDIKPYLMLVQFLLQNPSGDNPEQRFDIVLQVFLDAVKRNLQFYKFMEVIIDFVFKIVSRIPQVKEWFFKKKNQWAFLYEWSQESKFPINPNDNQQNLKVYKKRNNMQLQQQFLRGEFVRNIVYREARLKRMEQLLNGSVNDLSGETDMDLIDLQDYKFTVGELVEIYNKRQEKLQPAQVEQVLDEMIQVKILNQQQVENYQQQNNNTQWIGCDTDKLMLNGTFKNQYKNKLLEYCAHQQQQMRMRQEMQGNPQMRQSVGQGSMSGGNPNDMEYDMNDNHNYGNQGNFGESDEDDNQSENNDIYD